MIFKRISSPRRCDHTLSYFIIGLKATKIKKPWVTLGNPVVFYVFLGENLVVLESPRSPFTMTGGLLGIDPCGRCHPGGAHLGAPAGAVSGHGRYAAGPKFPEAFGKEPGNTGRMLAKFCQCQFGDRAFVPTGRSVC